MFLILLLTLLMNSFSWGQVEPLPGYLNNRYLLANPFSIPLYFNLEGDLTLLKQGVDDFYLMPSFLGGFSFSKASYLQPLYTQNFHLSEVSSTHLDQSMIHVIRRKVELGVGLGALVKKQFTLGLVPFKGAQEVFIFSGKRDSRKMELFKLTNKKMKLSDFATWNRGDWGLVQRYGGISLNLDASYLVGNIAAVNVTFYNHFLIQFEKINEDEIIITVSEEKSKKNHLSLGPFFSSFLSRRLKARRMSFRLQLNIHDLRHQDFFRQMMNGKISDVQEHLRPERQKIVWAGREKEFFVGIPVLLGKELKKGSYQFKQVHSESSGSGHTPLSLSIREKRNTGVLTKVKNFRDHAYKSEDKIFFIWSTELSKASSRVLDQRLFHIARSLGMEQSDFQENKTHQYFQRKGPVFVQFTSFLKKEELDSMKSFSSRQIEKNLISTCERFHLKCQKKRLREKILKAFLHTLSTPWGRTSSKMTKLLLKHPVLLKVIFNLLRKDNDHHTYFKFYSQNYQSLVGWF